MNALFEPFVEKIHLFYEKACEDADVDPVMLRRSVEGCPSTKRKQVCGQPGTAPVHITWNGIMTSGLQPGSRRVARAPCSEQAANRKTTAGAAVGRDAVGHRCIELSVPLAKHRLTGWGDWARA